MAETAFVFRVTGPLPNGLDVSLGLLECDAAVQVVHTGDVLVTRHPVERGADITDHTKAEPVSLSIEAIFSNTPATKTGTPDPSRAKTAFDTIETLKKNGTVITIVSKLHNYSNMVIKQAVYPQDTRTGDALRAHIQLQEITLVSSRTIAPPTKVTNAKGKTKGGKQVASPATEKTSKSFLANVVDAFTGNGVKKAPLNIAAGH